MYCDRNKQQHRGENYCLQHPNYFSLSLTSKHLHSDQHYSHCLSRQDSFLLFQKIGLPTVGYFSSELNLSSNYFGDLIKKETGKTAQEYIQSKLIEIAKERIFDHSKTVSQVAYELGFKYPQHFTRLFKQRVGHSPNEYRLLN
jgi:AraC family transcriptional activator of pobA